MPLDDLDRRLTRLEEQLRALRQELEEKVSEILVTLQGPPRDESIRGRLHKLETDAAAARAAEAAVNAAKAMMDNARRDRVEASERHWTHKHTVATLFCVVVGTLCAVVTTIAVVFYGG